MKEINIYLATGARSPKRQRAGYIFVLEMETGGEPATLTGSGRLEGTKNRIEVEALNRALERVKLPVSIHLYTDSCYLASAFGRGWLGQWQRSGWRTRKGEPVANMEEWQKTQALLDGKEIQVHGKGNHAYRSWMHWELEKEEA